MTRQQRATQTRVAAVAHLQQDRLQSTEKAKAQGPRSTQEACAMLASLLVVSDKTARRRSKAALELIISVTALSLEARARPVASPDLCNSTWPQSQSQSAPRRCLCLPLGHMQMSIQHHPPRRQLAHLRQALESVRKACSLLRDHGSRPERGSALQAQTTAPLRLMQARQQTEQAVNMQPIQAVTLRRENMVIFTRLLKHGQPACTWRARRCGVFPTQ